MAFDSNSNLKLKAFEPQGLELLDPEDCGAPSAWMGDLFQELFIGCFHYFSLPFFPSQF